MLCVPQISVGGSFVSDLLVGYVAVGIGIAFAFVPVTIAALAGVADHEAGLGSGLISTVTSRLARAIGVTLARRSSRHFTPPRQFGNLGAGGAHVRLPVGLLVLAALGVASVIDDVRLRERPRDRLVGGDQRVLSPGA